MSMLRRLSSFATSVESLSGACLLVLVSDSVLMFQEANLICEKIFFVGVCLDFSGPGGPVGFTRGPSWVRRRCPFTRREWCVILLETLVGK